MNKRENNNSDISNETLNKALEILDLASTSNTLKKSEGSKGPEGEEEEEEDNDKKEMVSKASAIFKSMSAENKDTDLIKSALVKKGFNEEIIKAAMASSEESKGSLSKSEISDIFKSHVSEITNEFDKKFKAVGVVLKKSMDKVEELSATNEEIKKSLEDTLQQNAELKTKIETSLKASNGPKSQMLSKSYQDRFGDEKAEGGKPSNKYNINHPADRLNLRNKITEMSGINKGEVSDGRLVKIAQEIEVTKMITPEAVNLLKSMDIEVVGS